MTRDLFDTSAMSGARFSPDRVYRYDLWRRITNVPLAQAKQCLFVMLNPSTADESVLDPTCTRCLNFARAWGYDAMRVVNLFAYRSTDPRTLEDVVDPIGVENDDAILLAAHEAALIVCAWGCSKQANLRGSSTSNRQREVVERLELAEHTLSVLKINADGTPAHPLYLSGALVPQIWQPEFRE